MNKPWVQTSSALNLLLKIESLLVFMFNYFAHVALNMPLTPKFNLHTKCFFFKEHKDPLNFEATFVPLLPVLQGDYA